LVDLAARKTLSGKMVPLQNQTPQSGIKGASVVHRMNLRL
jgi:hypothetical protein